jgi:hypothetical protein
MALTLSPEYIENYKLKVQMMCNRLPSAWMDSGIADIVVCTAYHDIFVKEGKLNHDKIMCDYTMAFAVVTVLHQILTDLLEKAESQQSQQQKNKKRSYDKFADDISNNDISNNDIPNEFCDMLLEPIVSPDEEIQIIRQYCRGYYSSESQIQEQLQSQRPSKRQKGNIIAITEQEELQLQKMLFAKSLEFLDDQEMKSVLSVLSSSSSSSSSSFM